jgi:hypothetical protein
MNPGVTCHPTGLAVALALLAPLALLLAACGGPKEDVVMWDREFSAELGVGQTYQDRLRGFLWGGEECNDAGPFTWSVADPIVTVEGAAEADVYGYSDITIKGLAVGETTITASADMGGWSCLSLMHVTVVAEAPKIWLSSYDHKGEEGLTHVVLRVGEHVDVYAFPEKDDSGYEYVWTTDSESVRLGVTTKDNECDGYDGCYIDGRAAGEAKVSVARKQFPGDPYTVDVTVLPKLVDDTAQAWLDAYWLGQAYADLTWDDGYEFSRHARSLEGSDSLDDGVDLTAEEIAQLGQVPAGKVAIIGYGPPEDSRCNGHLAGVTTYQLGGVPAELMPKTLAEVEYIIAVQMLAAQSVGRYQTSTGGSATVYASGATVSLYRAGTGWRLAGTSEPLVSVGEADPEPPSGGWVVGGEGCVYGYPDVDDLIDEALTQIPA